MRGAALLILLAVVLAATAAPVTGQIEIGEGNTSRYDQMYGTPVEVQIDDLVSVGGGTYSGRAIRTHGRLEMLIESGASGRAYSLRGSLYAVRIAPVGEARSDWESEAPRWVGREVEVTGVFQETQMSGSAPMANAAMHLIQFWNFLGPPDKDDKGEIKATTMRLEGLVQKPGAYDGKNIRVVGKFRGRNLYGDLPVSSQRGGSDWVIKDDLYAVWVTGRKPKGSGFDLDSNLKRDTGKWIEVIGRATTRGSVTYIQAMRIALASPPSATAEAQPPPPPPERPKKPPVVVFALPLDGEAEVAPDSRFVVQFSKDMDEKTFNGHVLLRYVGPRLPGDREFDGLRLTYDNGRRALTIDPGDTLRPRRQLELVLLPGISDLEGLSLVSRTGRMFTEAVDVLRFRTGT